LLTAQRDVAAARRFPEQAINQHDIPDSITIDKSGANTAAIHSVNEHSDLNIKLRQSKYLNNLVEQDHRAIKRRTRPMLGFKSFATATKLLAGIELAHMLRKGQMKSADGQVTSAASQYYSLAY
jgi:putative transposase